jgi:hypothetical protein
MPLICHSLCLLVITTDNCLSVQCCCAVHKLLLLLLQALKRLEQVKASGGRGVANAGDDLGLEDFEAAAVSGSPIFDP